MKDSLKLFFEKFYAAHFGVQNQTNQPTKLKTKKPKPLLDNVIRYYVMEVVPEKSS